MDVDLGCSQMVVESETSAQEYGDLVVDEGSPVNADLHFDSKFMHLYVMTLRKVSLPCGHFRLIFCLDSNRGHFR